MNTIWTVFVVCFLHQFLLMKCESDNPDSYERQSDNPDSYERQSDGDREHENENTENSEEMLLKELDRGEDLEDIKLYSKGDENENVQEPLNVKDPIRPLNHPEVPPYQEQYELEKIAGDPADDFGTNMHHYYPTEFRLNDLGRRFVLQYPYREVTALKDDVEPKSVLDNVAKANKKIPYTKEDLKLLPVKASPEKVLRVAIQSAIEQANQPQDSYDVNEKDILRSGDYWDSVWVEKVNPETVLRTFQERTGYKLGDEKQRSHKPKLNSLKTKVMPGSKLYELVSVLKKSSPRLLYVINDNQIKDSLEL